MTEHSHQVASTDKSTHQKAETSPLNNDEYAISPTDLTPTNILRLQRLIGNTATNRLIQRIPRPASATDIDAGTGTSAPSSGLGGNVAREDFDRQMTERFGVNQVVTGTLQDQISSMQRSGQPEIQIPDWEAWSPDASSDVYQNILDGVQDFADGIGGLPPFNRLMFFKMAYEPNHATGVVTPKPSVGAEFGAGVMYVYQTAETAENVCLWGVAVLRLAVQPCKIPHQPMIV